jgi:hypothetical protein
MNSEFVRLKNNQVSNYILPFLWMKGESQELIRREIEKIDECGMKAICLESRPHPDFMGEQWWSDLRMIIEEAKKRDMKVWILDDAHFPTGYANGLIKTKYPERKKRYLNYNVVNVWGASGEVTIPVSRMTKPLVSFLELDKPRNIEEQKKNKLVAVVAYPLREENQLDESGVIDLTDSVIDGVINYTFPQENYRVFVVYETATDGGNEDYINMMDRESVSTLIEAVYEPHYEHFKEDFGKTIVGFFSDEPEIGNIGGFKSNVQIGNSKMPLPWSEQLKEKMLQVYGESWYIQLPLLWTETLQMKECTQARFNFMNAVSNLYSENFSSQLGEWCEAHNVEYIGHVVEDDNLHGRLGNGAAHYFRAMKGQHMAGIDVIGNQITIGGAGYLRMGIFDRDGEFLHYALGKMGASSGHLDPNKQGRTMCELFGASGWKTGVRDMKYILDHVLSRGINTLVPHAFSMADYPDMDCPPHFYARGNNPQFKHFCDLMKYANRMCEILSGGKHVAEVAVLYHADAEWSGNCMLIQKPAKELLQNQIEFDFVSADMLAQLADFQGRVEGDKFYLNGQQFTTLIIPYTQRLPFAVFQFIKENPKLCVIFLEELPESVVGAELPVEELKQALTSCNVIGLKQLGEWLKHQGRAELQLLQEFPELVYYHYKKDVDCYMLNNESAFQVYHGEVKLPLKHGAVYYDGMKNEFYRMKVTEKGGDQYVALELAPYGSCIIFDVNEDELPVYMTYAEKLGESKSKMNLSEGWTYSLATEKQYPNFTGETNLEKLEPISHNHPNFSGHICYTKQIEVCELNESMYLEFEHVAEVLELWINDNCVGTVLYPPYVFNISEYLLKGKNTIKAVVTTTLDRDQNNYPEPFIVLNHEASEGTGMYGDVVLHRGR